MWNDIAPQVRPGRIAMKEQYCLASAFIQVMHLRTEHVDVMRLVGIVRRDFRLSNRLLVLCLATRNRTNRTRHWPPTRHRLRNVGCQRWILTRIRTGFSDGLSNSWPSS